MSRHITEHGYGYWAVEVPGITKFAGFIGLRQTTFAAAFTQQSNSENGESKPCVDLGWRLAFEFWNRGYATEGARAAIEFGFNELKLSEIVSFTVPVNAFTPRDGKARDDTRSTR